MPLLQAINHVRLGHLEEARKEVKNARERQPGLTTEKWRRASFYRQLEVLERQVAALQEAGLPEA